VWRLHLEGDADGSSSPILRGFICFEAVNDQLEGRERTKQNAAICGIFVSLRIILFSHWQRPGRFAPAPAFYVPDIFRASRRQCRPGRDRGHGCNASLSCRGSCCG
jgi:hypothetical protein